MCCESFIKVNYDIIPVSFTYFCHFFNRLLADTMNVTYIHLGGHVELEKYRYVYFSIMVTGYVLILSSNSTVVCLVVIHKNLHEPMYIFIAALLINSIIFSTSIYPKLLIDFLSEKQIVSYEACLIQVFAFYTLSCSEYLLLAAMAFDRFVSICKPLQYHTIMRKRTVSVFLVLAWFVPACHIAVPFIGNANSKLCSFTLKGIFCNNSVNYLFCVASKALLMYGLVVLFNIAVFPMVFILFTYTMILIVAYRSCGDVRKKAAQTCLPHLLVLINYSCLFAYDMIIVRLESDISKAVRFAMTMCIIMCSPLFNPVIYGLKMKEIYKHLRRLFSQTRRK
ncbi:olfactory receptor 4E1-like [Poecilia latipinna]|uniref:olfactory receptor 4E1-like n=1 Tax=Poecilia mexicana TaxID=48701 RepID=UPI00072EC0B3|nr:PREDICTED: olfactory receptor 4E1-like [Poecilia mexicana]XP_014876655.1 PREDICTED: olfactory receptor 4E1-like [Poecilia latipinna]